MAVVIQLSELEPLTQRRPASEVPIGEQLVDDRHTKRGLPIRCREEPPLTQLRTDRCKVVATHITNQRDLADETVFRLALQQIERRGRGVGERDDVDRSGAHDARNRTHVLDLRIDERDAAIEILVPEQWRLEGQEPLALESEIGVPKMPKGLQEQAPADQQHNGERRLDDDQRMLERVTSRARCASSASESFLRRDSRSAQRGREPEGHGGCDGHRSRKCQHSPIERDAPGAHGLGHEPLEKSHCRNGQRETGKRT